MFNPSVRVFWKLMFVWVGGNNWNWGFFGISLTASPDTLLASFSQAIPKNNKQKQMKYLSDWCKILVI